MDLSRFKTHMDTKEIEKLEKEYRPNNGGYTDIPSGTYAVTVEKMEVSHQNGQYGDFDRLNIDFKIIDGEKKGQHIFYNGTFNNKVDSGYRATAELISQLFDGELNWYDVIPILEQDISAMTEDIIDLFQELHGKFSYDLNYKVQEQTKINPNTNQPYKANRWFSIEEVYDM